MAEDFDTVTIPELDNLTIALTSYFATSNLNGKLGKATIQDFITFIAPYIQGVSASGFVPVTGTVLPNSPAGSFSIIGAGTFTQTTGGSITTTALLNLIANGNGTTWSLIKAVDTSAFLNKSDYNFGGAYTTLAAANAAITNTVVNGKNNRDGKRVDIGTAGNYTPYWWKGGFADSNLVPFFDGLTKVSDIVNDITTGGASNPLSAEQGKVLAQNLFTSRSAVINVIDSVSALATGSTGRKIQPSTSLSNDSFDIQSNGNIVAKKDLYFKAVFRIDWTMTNQTTGITRAQFKVNDVVYMYELSKPTGAALNTNKIETPVIFLPKNSYVSFDIWQNSTQPADATSTVQLIEVANSGIYLTGRNTAVTATLSAETATVFETTDFGDLDITNAGTSLIFNKGGLFNFDALIDWTYPASANPTPIFLLLSVNGTSKVFDKTTKTNGGDWTSNLAVTLKINSGDTVSLIYNFGTGTPSASVKRSKLGIRAVTGNVIENSSTQTVTTINTDFPLTFNNVISGSNTLTGYSGQKLISIYVSASNSPGSATNIDISILKNGTKIGTYRKNVSINQTLSFSKVENLVPSDVISFVVNAGYLAAIAYTTAAITSVPNINDSILTTDVKPRLTTLEAQVAALSGDTNKTIELLNRQSLKDIPFSYMDVSNQTKMGVVIDLGAAGQPDAGMVESPSIWYEKSLGLFVMIFTQYSSTNSSSAVASIGWATSSDLLSFTKKGTFYTAKGGAVGTRTEVGMTGPVMVVNPNTNKYHLFYIALDQPGYEQGTKKLCRADGNSINDFITNTAIRNQDPVISPTGPQAKGWRSIDVYHPCFVAKGNKWYCFFNAGGDISTPSAVKERIGYATSDSPDGVWTVDDVNSPILKELTENSNKIVAGDPSIIKIGNWYIMGYFTNQFTTRDDWAYTDEQSFPLGWKRAGISLDVGSTGSFDATAAAKPLLVVANNKVYHYYTAVNSSNRRTIALSISS